MKLILFFYHYVENFKKFFLCSKRFLLYCIFCDSNVRGFKIENYLQDRDNNVLGLYYVANNKKKKKKKKKHLFLLVVHQLSETLTNHSVGHQHPMI